MSRPEPWCRVTWDLQNTVSAFLNTTAPTVWTNLARAGLAWLEAEGKQTSKQMALTLQADLGLLSKLGTTPPAPPCFFRAAVDLVASLTGADVDDVEDLEGVDKGTTRFYSRV
ncbi:hypothetical protein E4U55_005295 [Claviceps digitariae]|nr:hypothetical protein E4U55_005295 [Claviceps digitariae]